MIHPASDWRFRLFTLLVALACMAGWTAGAADDATVGEKAREVAKETSTAMSEAGSAAADTAREVWDRVDAARLKNRTRDEITAWVIMGVLAGALTCMFTTQKLTMANKLGRLVLGLGGAFLGSMVVHAARIDFGWSLVVMHYEDLIFSLAGAFLLVILWRLLRYRVGKKALAD